MKYPRPIGKPLKGKVVRDSTSVRIEPHVRDSLNKEFGSVANAVYFLYEGIQEFRDIKGLPKDAPKSTPKDQRLTQKEMEVVKDALVHFIETMPYAYGRKIEYLKTLLIKVLTYMESKEKK